MPNNTTSYILRAFIVEKRSQNKYLVSCTLNSKYSAQLVTGISAQCLPKGEFKLCFNTRCSNRVSKFMIFQMLSNYCLMVMHKCVYSQILFLLKEKSCAVPKATLKSVTDFVVWLINRSVWLINLSMTYQFYLTYFSYYKYWKKILYIGWLSNPVDFTNQI